jgi:hypothetical protein
VLLLLLAGLLWMSCGGNVGGLAQLSTSCLPVPAGSGKTTLLSILSGTMDSISRDSYVEGSVSLGGETRWVARAYIGQGSLGGSMTQ